MANKDGATSLLFAVPRLIGRIHQWLHKLTAGESIALVVVIIVVLNTTGFCWYRLRWLAPNTLFTAAIAANAHKIADFTEGRVSTAEEYLAKHPYCCTFGDYSMFDLSPFQAPLGFKIYVINVIYRRSAADIARMPREGDFYDAYVEVSCCGHTFHTIGTTLKNCILPMKWFKPPDDNDCG
jgi:hypothetical protein